MKAKLIFDLDDIDDMVNYKRCVKSQDMAFALFEITRNLKKKCSYGVEKMDGVDALEYIFDKIYDEIELNNIIIDELII